MQNPATLQFNIASIPESDSCIYGEALQNKCPTLPRLEAEKEQGTHTHTCFSLGEECNMCLKSQRSRETDVPKQETQLETNHFHSCRVSARQRAFLLFMFCSFLGADALQCHLLLAGPTARASRAVRPGAAGAQSYAPRPADPAEVRELVTVRRGFTM